MLDFLRDAPLYTVVSVGDRDVLLTHAGLGHFRRKKPLSQYQARTLLRHRPATDERYFPNTLTVFGHTPTAYYGAAANRALRRDTISPCTNRATVLYCRSCPFFDECFSKDAREV